MTSQSRRDIWTVHVPLIVYLALLFTLSSIPTLPAPDYGIELSDKVNHFLAYGLLGMLGYRSVKRLAGDRTTGARIVAALLFCALYGVIDELHQMLVPGRSAEVADWIADLLGGLTGIVVMGALGRWMKARRERKDV